MTATGSAVLVRPAAAADAAGLARVHVDTWRTTYRGLLPDEFFAGPPAYERGQARWAGILADDSRGDIVYVADCPEEGVVGFVHAGPLRTPLPGRPAEGGSPGAGPPATAPGSPGTGEVYALYILEHRQGAGLGRRLMASAGTELRRRGYGPVVVWVLAENPARGFYERLGGREVAASTVTIGGRELPDVAYCWPDSVLLAGLEGAGPAG
ncbi:MAG: GNAT family N-acetyltransferase [Bacillota bacterium]|jgi:GNAT superfamily N-acetyltransferase